MQVVFSIDACVLYSIVYHIYHTLAIVLVPSCYRATTGMPSFGGLAQQQGTGFGGQSTG